MLNSLCVLPYRLLLHVSSYSAGQLVQKSIANHNPTAYLFIFYRRKHPQYKETVIRQCSNSCNQPCFILLLHRFICKIAVHKTLETKKARLLQTLYRLPSRLSSTGSLRYIIGTLDLRDENTFAAVNAFIIHFD